MPPCPRRTRRASLRPAPVLQGISLYQPASTLYQPVSACINLYQPVSTLCTARTRNVATPASAMGPGVGGGLAGRANIFDGDEFDVFHRDDVRLEGIRVKQSAAAGRRQQELEEAEEAEAEQLRRKTTRLLQLQQVDEAREEVERAQAALYAGDASAEERMAVAQAKVDGLVAAFDAEAGGGWAEDDDGYDDEYDDALDGLGFLSMSEGQSNDEVVGQVADRRKRQAAATAMPGLDELTHDKMDAADEDDDDPEPGAGPVEKAAGGRHGLEAPHPFVSGLGRGRGAGARRGGGAGQEVRGERAPRGRGWGTANAKAARRKEANKSAIGNHHRKDRAARKLRGAFGPPA